MTIECSHLQLNYLIMCCSNPLKVLNSLAFKYLQNDEQFRQEYLNNNGVFSTKIIIVFKTQIVQITIRTCVLYVQN